MKHMDNRNYPFYSPLNVKNFLMPNGVNFSVVCEGGGVLLVVIHTFVNTLTLSILQSDNCNILQNIISFRE